MAYISYDSRPRAHGLTKTRRQPRFAIAWVRLAVLAASLGAWVGLIAVARAVF